MGLIILIPALLILAVVAWNVIAWPGFRSEGAAEPRAVSILIPARDEERNIADCLDRALAQGEVVDEVLVYDDHSVDATRKIVEDYAARDGRVRLIEPRRLPDGWCGKNFACAELARNARVPWLLFLDADARLSEGAAARLVAEAQARRVTLMSAWPALTAIGFWERALMPMLNFVVLSLFPAPLSLKRTDESLALVHGACMLVDREAYFRVGGHAAVRDEIFEDQRLARLWRANGYRSLCLDGRTVVSVRMYDSLQSIWRGFEKNFFPAFRREASFWAFLLLHALMLAPAVLLIWNRSWPVWASLTAVHSMRVMLAIRFRHSPLSVLLHTVAEVVLIAVGLSSWWRCKSGRGVEWKGRRYHTGESRGREPSGRQSSEEY